MRKLIVISLVVVLLGAGCRPNPETYEQVALTWVEKNAPTYVHDGSGLHVSESVQGGCSSCWDIFLDFESNAAGYGDRTDEMLAQVITPHTTRVRFLRGDIIEVVTDQVYDEMNARKLENIFLPQ